MTLGQIRILRLKLTSPGEKVKQWGHPLWLAANRGHYEVVKLLIESGANPNTAVYASGNAVCWAYQYGHKRVADLMFQHGAVADLLSYCLTNNLPAIAEILHRDASERKELLWSAILAGNIDVVTMGLRDNPQYDDTKCLIYWNNRYAVGDWAI